MDLLTIIRSNLEGIGITELREVCKTNGVNWTLPKLKALYNAKLVEVDRTNPDKPVLKPTAKSFPEHS